MGVRTLLAGFDIPSSLRIGHNMFQALDNSKSIISVTIIEINEEDYYQASSLGKKRTLVSISSRQSALSPY
jgi:hypothetical protein